MQCPWPQVSGPAIGVDHAVVGTVAELIRRFSHAPQDPDAADVAALARYEKRGITLSRLPDGSVHIRGLADEVTGALLATAINAANPPVSGDRRSAAQSRMDAVADICRKHLGFPGAPMPGGGHAHLIPHHLQHWALGGATTIANGALPCAGHHTMCHEDWTLLRLPDGSYQFRLPNGKPSDPNLTHPHTPTTHNRQ
jgi:Domain of unknown function (DUF222)